MSTSLRHTTRRGDAAQRHTDPVVCAITDAEQECEALRRSNEEKDEEIEELMRKIEELADAVITAEGVNADGFSSPSASDAPMALSSQESQVSWDNGSPAKPNDKEPPQTADVAIARRVQPHVVLSDAAVHSQIRSLKTKNVRLRQELERFQAVALLRTAERDQAETLCLDYAQSAYKLEKIVGLLEGDTQLLNEQVKNGAKLIETLQRDLAQHAERIGVLTNSLRISEMQREEIERRATTVTDGSVEASAHSTNGLGTGNGPVGNGPVGNGDSRESKINELAAAQTALDSRLERRARQLAEAERRMADARATAAEHARSIKQLETELWRLQTFDPNGHTECHSSDAEHSSCRNGPNSDDKEIFSNPEDHIASLRKRLTFAQGQRAQAEIMCRALSHRLEESEKRAKKSAELERIINLMEGNIKLLRSQVEDGAELFDSATTNLAHYVNRVQELTDNLKVTEMQRDQSERLAFPFFSTLERMEGTLEEETRQLSKALRRIKQLETEQDTLDSRLLSKSKTLAKLKCKIADAKTIAAEHEQTIKQLDMELWRAQTTLPTSDEIRADDPAPEILFPNTPTPKSDVPPGGVTPADLFPAAVSE